MKKYALVVVAALTAVIAILGLSSSGAGASTHHAPVPVEHFTILAVNSTDNALVIGTGPLHARGTDVTVNDNRDVFRFRLGALRVNHRITSGSSVDTFDATTCYGTHTESGTYAIPYGYGRFRHVFGFGRYQLSISFVNCTPNDQNSTPRLFVERVDASGPLYRVPVAAH